MFLTAIYLVIGLIVATAIETAYAPHTFIELRGLTDTKKRLAVWFSLLIIGLTWPIWVGFYIGARIKRK